MSLSNPDARPCDLATTGTKSLDEPRDEVSGIGEKPGLDVGPNR